MGVLPPAADFWRDDRFFGSQFLNGCNPDSLIKCTELPPHFPVTQQLIGNLLDSADTLENALTVSFAMRGDSSSFHVKFNCCQSEY